MNVSDLLARCCCALGSALMFFGAVLVPVNSPVLGDPGGGGVTLKCESVCAINCGKWLTVRVGDDPPMTTCWHISFQQTGYCKTDTNDCNKCTANCESTSQMQNTDCTCISNP